MGSAGLVEDAAAGDGDGDGEDAVAGEEREDRRLLRRCRRGILEPPDCLHYRQKGPAVEFRVCS